MPLSLAPRRAGQPAGPVSWSLGLSYGLLALPLAFVAMPLYIALPRHYAQEFAVPLSLLGLCLLLARLGDAVCDPWIGRWVDRQVAHSRRRVLVSCVIAAIVLVLALQSLFFPWRSSGTGLWWSLGVSLTLTYLAWSVLSITHQSWAVRLGEGDEVQARWISWREGLALLGVLLASVVTAAAGWSTMIVVCALGLGVGLLGLTRAPWVVSAREVAAAPTASPWHSQAFRQLLAVFVVNGMASAVPATLVLFFVRDRLQAASWEPLFLGGYFAAAAVSMPLWVTLVGRRGLVASWRLGMLMSVAAFAWALGLNAGDRWPYLAICVASGLALGADLVVPAALLTRVIRSREGTPHQEGQYFGWWTFANKLNLALAAGVALPLLEWWGYVPGSTQAHSLQTLSLAYGLLPCVLKLLAWGLLQHFHRQALGLALNPERSPS